MKPKNVRGFTLLEVLVALLVFSLGMMGMAGLLTVSVKTNHAAYLRTQATFLAQGMADRMRANVLGLWNNSYNLPLAAISASVPPTTCKSPNTCNYSDVALRDIAVWKTQVSTFLPSSQAMIQCAPTSTLTASELLILPPFNGTCEIRIDWNDISNEAQMRSTGVYKQTFDWVFQP